MNLRNTFRAVAMVALVQFSLCTTPVAAAILSPGDILVTDQSPGTSTEGAVYKIDPVTGDRMMISGPGVGSGPELHLVVGIAVDSSGNIYVSSSTSDPDSGAIVGHGIYRIDASTGDRTEFSGPTIGSGVSFGGPFGPLGMMVDLDGSLLVANQTDSFTGVGAVYRVDLATGNRTIVSGPGVGSGTTLQLPSDIALDVAGDILLIDNVSVLRVDPITGNRTTVSDMFTGGGPNFDDPLGIEVLSTGEIVVADIGANVLFPVAPVSGTRSILSGPGVGIGPAMSPYGVAIANDGMLIVSENANGNILAIDPVTGDRTVLSGLGVGSGPQIGTPAFLTIVPIPEPATWMLLFVGLMTVGARQIVRTLCKGAG